MSDLLIHSGTIVNEGRSFRGYIVVREGVIVEVGEGKYPGEAANFRGQTVDAQGLAVMPGVIDAHVHFREPGMTWKGDMASESAAAVAGGVTSVLEMPNTQPLTVSMEALERKLETAFGAAAERRGGASGNDLGRKTGHKSSAKLHTNADFFFGATNENLAEVKKFNLAGGQIVKLFNGSSTGNMLVDNPKAIAALFAEFGGVIAVHAEDEAIIRRNTEIYKQQLGNRATAAAHPLIRSAEACYVATARLIELAEKYGTKLHVCHVSTERELAMFQGSKSPVQKKITAEACVPHLWFAEGDYARLGNRIKCNPAIKAESDRAALRNALRTNKIDLIATDHAPHTAEEKARGYWEAPSGIPMVQHSLNVAIELVKEGEMTMEGLVEKMCHAPARRFGIEGRGFLRAGYWADIVVVNPMAEWVVEPENIRYKCRWSPLEGEKMTSAVELTVVNGEVAYSRKGGVSDEPKGQKLVLKG